MGNKKIYTQKEMDKIGDKQYVYGIILGVIVGGFVIGLLVIASGINNEPQGIGGFVYQEIQWGEQTYNILTENCKNPNNPNHVPMLFFDNKRSQFYCTNYYDCKRGNCRMGDYYFNPIIQTR